MSKCPICDRGIKTGQYCQQDQRELDKERAELRKRKRIAFKYLAYAGHVVGLFPKNGNLVASYIGMSMAGIPKAKLIDLNEYCEGFTRHQIKAFKATVLRVAKA